MGAVRLKTVADLRRRRLQTAVIAVVLCLASGAATMAASILVESDGPFDRAFAAANGAHLVVSYDPDTDPRQLSATGGAPTVTTSAGPWPIASASVGVSGRRIGGLEISGRPTPDPSIDAVTISAGRWWNAPGEAVLDQDTARLLGASVGDRVQVFPPVVDKRAATTVAGRTLTVVGIAGSVSTPEVTAWMSPEDVIAIDPGRPPMRQMLYRVDPSATDADLRSAIGNITSSLGAEAVSETRTYLEVKAGVDQLADLYVPILLAFSIFALLAAAFTIANVVSGVVLTNYGAIGVMKAIGYTPTQVTAMLLAQIMVPAAVGVVAGIVVGTAASMPVIEQTAASFGLPAASAVSWPVVGAVLAIALAVAAVAAIGPAIRAGRISAVAAMTRGAAPSVRADGGRLRRLGMRLPVAIQVRLGIAAGLAHPVRASMTLGALVVGVAALTFAIALNWALVAVMADLSRSESSPIRVELVDRSVPPDHVTSAIANDPNTARSVSTGQVQASIPRVGAVPFVGYRGDSSWIGYALIRGRWFESAGEAVAPTAFFTQTGLGIGDTTTASLGGRQVTLRLVGEIFDLGNEGEGNVLVRGTWSDLATLDPAVTPTAWEARPVDGLPAAAYQSALRESVGNGAQVAVQEDSSRDESFLLFLTVVALMGAVLVAISLGGVFNTVLLETHQRTRELAVLKAIGLTPAQVVGMVLASIVPVSVVAGLIGVPLGLIAQRAVLDYMGEVAGRTDIPPAIHAIVGPAMLVALGLSGLLIGAAGAYLPAQRAARARIAPVLQAE